MSDTDKAERQRAYRREYRKSEKGKAAIRRYQQSIKGRNTRIQWEGAESYAERVLRSLPPGTDLY